MKCGCIWPLLCVMDRKFYRRIWPLSGVMGYVPHSMSCKLYHEILSCRHLSYCGRFEEQNQESVVIIKLQPIHFCNTAQGFDQIHSLVPVLLPSCNWIAGEEHGNEATNFRNLTCTLWTLSAYLYRSSLGIFNQYWRRNSDQCGRDRCLIIYIIPPRKHNTYLQA